ncbi:MAG: hypothetical protein D6761_01680 [Candidatus Dadabacteria bacterium]|nr:MAG: hypothetical protein D6761_01680 [Candidatus Dadabacteria bacterium]
MTAGVVIAALAGCTTFQPTVPRQSAPAPTPYTQPDAESVRHQPVMDAAATEGRYDRVVPRLKEALAGRKVRVAIFWDAVIPESDGGWQADSRLSLELDHHVSQPQATTSEQLAVALSREFFSRPSLESGTPPAQDPLAAFVVGRLLDAGAEVADLKLAALRAQPELDKDQVYRRIRTLIEQADLVVEVFTQGDRIAVRVRDVREARLRAIDSQTVGDVVRRSRPIRILDGAGVDARSVTDRQAAALAVVASALRQALAES